MADPFEGWTEAPAEAPAAAPGPAPESLTETPEVSAVPAGAPKGADPFAGWTDVPAGPAASSPVDPEAKERALDATVGTLFRQSWVQDADKEGGILRLSRESGLSPDVVRSNFDELQKSWASANMFRAPLTPEADKSPERRWRENNPELAKLLLEHPEASPVITRDVPLSLFAKTLNKAIDIIRWSPVNQRRLAEDFPPANPEDAANQTEAQKLLDAQKEPLFKPTSGTFVQDEKAAEMQDGWSGFGGLAVPNRALVPFLRAQETWSGLAISRKYSELSRLRTLGSNTQQLEEEILKLEQASTPRDYNEGAIEQFFSDTATAATSTGAALERGAQAGGIAGAVAGTGAGLATLAATRSPPLAGEAATDALVSVGSLFGKGGMAFGTYELEQGSAYRDMLNAKANDGSPAMDEPTARVASAVYGVLAAGEEVAAWGPMFRAMGPIGAVLREGDTKAFAAALVKAPGFQATLKRLAGNWAASTLAESGEEGLQDATQQAVEYFARAHARGSLGTQGVDLSKSGGAFMAALQGSAGLAGFEVGMDLFTHATHVEKSRQSGQVVAAIAGLKDSATVNGAPHLVAKMVEDATARTGEPVTSLYVDAHAFVKLFQDAKTDPDEAARQLMGDDGPKRLAQAVVQGPLGKLEVPVAAYLEKWGATPAAEHLAEDTTTDPKLYTSRQLRDLAPEISAKARELVREHEAAAAPEAELGARWDALEQQLVATGTHTKAQAASAIAPLKAFVRTAGVAFGMSPDALFEDLEVKVRQGNLAPAGKFASPALLLQRAARLTPRERADELFRDAGTGLPNEKALNETPAPKGHGLFFHLGVEGLKYFNDTKSHDTGDLLLRAAARTLAGTGPAYKVGSDFAGHAKSQAHLDELIAAVKQTPGLEGLQVTGAVGKTLEEAAAAHEALRKGLVDTGQRANPRPLDLSDPTGQTALAAQKPFGLKSTAAIEALSKDRAKTEHAPHLVERVGKQTAEEYFKEAYINPKTGALTAAGWNAIPRKKGVAALDLAGLRLANGLFGQVAGDKMIERVSELAKDLGGINFDFANLHGDEYALQHEDPDVVELFVGLLKFHLAENPIDAVDPRTGELTKLQVGIHDGFGAWSYEAADRDLNDRKARAKADARAVSRGVGGSGQAEARASEVDVERGRRAGPEDDGRAGARGDSRSGERHDEAAGVGQELAVEPADQAAAYIKTLRSKANKKNAKAWLKFVTGKSAQRPNVPFLIKSLFAARFGLVDPVEGFTGDQYGRDLSAPAENRRGPGAKGAVHGKVKFRGAWEDEQYQKLLRGESLFFQEPMSTEPKTLESGPKDGEKTPRGYITFARNEMRRIFEIALNPSADMSTFVHESAHLFLELFADLAERNDAPTKVKEDFDTTLKWLGVENRAGIATEHHEQWARGFERYLLEGKSPSAQLDGAFERFRLWLSEIYKSVARLGVELSPDIRGVFDRLLATDEEVRRQSDKMGSAAMSHEAFGGTPEQYQQYLEAVARVVSNTTKRVRLQVLKERERSTERWWREEAAKEKLTAEEDYEKLKARRVQRALRGQAVDGLRSEPIGLDREAVEKAIGKEGARKVLVKKNGTSPDLLAEAWGYPTGEAMLKDIDALAERKQWVKDTVDERMKTKHPGALEDRTKLRDEVAKGLHGDLTESVFLDELAALKAKNYQLTFNPEANRHQAIPLERVGLGPPEGEVAKQAASAIVHDSTIGRLNVGNVQQLERAYGEDALRAAAKGNYSEAINAKRQQLLQFHIWKLQATAREQRDAFLERATAMTSDKARGRLGKAHPTYRDGADMLLEALKLKQRVASAPRVSVDELFGQLARDGETIAVDQDELSALLNRLQRSTDDYRTLTVDEMRVMDGMLRQISTAAAHRNTVLIDGKREDREEWKAKIIGEARVSMPLFAPIPTREAETLKQSAGRVWSAFDGALLKPENMLSWLAGGDTEQFIKSAAFRAMVKPLQGAKAFEQDIMKKHIAIAVKAFDAMPAKVRRRMTESIDGRAMFPNHIRDKVPQKRFEILMMRLNAGNESNLSRLTEGRHITEAELVAAEERIGMTREEYAWVQSVWDASESLKPLSFDMEERDTGIRPEEIVARPFLTPHGTFRGGYFPAVYDRDVTTTGQRQQADAVAALFDQSYTRPGTSRSYLKKRVEGFTDVIALSPASINRHFAQVAHDIAFREPIRSVAGLILDEDIQEMLRERLGPERAKQFLLWAKDVATMRGVDGGEHARVLMDITRWLRGNTVTMALGYSIPNALEDFTSNLLSAIPASDLKASHLTAAMAEFAASPLQTRTMVLEKSGELRARAGHVQRDLAKQVKSLTAKGPFARGPLAFYKDHAFAFAEVVDVATSTPIWLGAYRQASTLQMTDAEAVDYADATVRKVMVSHSAVDQSAIMRDKSVIGTTLMFFGAFNTFYNQFRDLSHNVAQADDLKTKARNAGAMLGLSVSLFLVGSLVRGQGPEPGEPPEQWLLRKMLLEGFLALFPFGGDIGGTLGQVALGHHPQPRNNSIAGVGGSIVQQIMTMTDDTKEDEARVKAFLRTLGPVTGLPITQPIRTGGYLYDWSQGNVAAENPLDVGAGLLYGENPKGQSANFRDLPAAVKRALP